MSRTRSGDSPNSKRSIKDATRNLERAVEELATAATDEVSGRAARLLDEAAARIRGETGGNDARNRDAESKPQRGEGRRERRSRRIHYHDYEDFVRRSRGLYLDRENRKIVGVCAGIARYLGIEAWIVRCVALTGLLFMFSVVFPAYWVAFFVMGHRPSARARGAGRGAWAGRSGRRKRAARRSRNSGRKRDHRSRAPEFGANFSPRQSLRAAQADFAEVELRLRRMEAFVTSDRYALERGFAEIGANAATAPSSETGKEKEQ